MNIDMALNTQRNDLQWLRVIGVMVMLCLVYMAAMASQGVDARKFAAAHQIMDNFFSVSLFWIFIVISFNFFFNSLFSLFCMNISNAVFMQFIFTSFNPITAVFNAGLRGSIFTISIQDCLRVLFIPFVILFGFTFFTSPLQ
jgi:hypothetical protein